VISAPENSNKFLKTRFWKEKPAENVVTLGQKAQATLVNMNHTMWAHILLMNRRV